MQVKYNMEKKIRIGINGFGRIGRLIARMLIHQEEFELVAINDLSDIETLTHLFKYDSAQGISEETISCNEKAMVVNGTEIDVYNEPNPSQLPWGAKQVDFVIEATGRFTSLDGASQHIAAGAKKVIISAPAKDPIKMIVMGVNEDILTSEDKVVSNASCTTNCLAPLVKVLDENFGIEKGYISTVHAYTADQNLHDAPHRDLRRSRAAALSIIPTSTGAAKAVGKVIPSMLGKLDGIALRVPIPVGSLTDFTAILKNATDTETVNSAFQNAANSSLKGYLEYSEAPIVSTDIVGNSHSSILDAPLTSVNGNLVKLVSWYDNEYGYSARTIDLMRYMAEM